jgi:broad specificity phosphatase PhoE
MKRVATALVLLLFCLAAACNRPQQGSTVVLIVRHAEKASDADDSPLTEAGVQRAQALAGAAQDAGVSAIYTTQFKRNRDTAQPLAKRLGVAPTEVPVNLQSPGDYGQRLAREIVEKHRGQTVLVIGHGNTITSIVEGLTGHNPELGDVQYSDLLVVTVPPAGTAGLIRAQYGAGAAGNSVMK